MILKKINFKKRKKKLNNRIVVSPMCQYSARNGCPTEWHYRHLSNLCISGASLVMLESTAVSNHGRISNKDLAISTNKQKKEFKKLINFLQSNKKTLVGIQLSHAGRKGSSEVPWIKKNSPLKGKSSWQTISSSELPKDKGWPKPKKMNYKDIKSVSNNFKRAILNSLEANFDSLELHMAHGYLLHQFLSPVCNTRNDNYGGSMEKRFKFPLEIARIARRLWPKNKLLGARITGEDHLKDGIKISETVKFCKKLENIGFDYVCVSSGGILTKTNLKFKKFFRARLAREIKKKTNLKVGITGMTDDFILAEKYIKKGYFDNVFIGRPFLKNPFFLYNQKILRRKGLKILPIQYARAF